VIRVYAVAEDTGEPLPYDSVRTGDLVAVVERVESTPEPEPEELWGHERVVEQLMADRAVLPMRFGTTQPDEAALRSALLERHDELCSALARVRGRVELAVRAVAAREVPEADKASGHESSASGDVPAADASGRDWLASRLAARRLADAVHEPLAAIAVAERRRPATGEVLRAAYLVDRAALERFRAALDGVRKAHPELDVVCTGPWPPYSFVQ
jgi:hypothetical protein